MTITERAAYLRGLAEGLELDADKKEVAKKNPCHFATFGNRSG